MKTIFRSFRWLLCLILIAPLVNWAEEPGEGWKTLQNSYGWSVQYPSDWQAFALGAVDPGKADAPKIGGESEKNIVNIHFDLWPSSDDEYSKLSPKQFIDKRNPLSRGLKLISESAFKADGLKGHRTIFLRAQGTRQDPQIEEFVVIKAVNRRLKGFFLIVYEEQRKEGGFIQDPSAWESRPVFEKILSTLKFER